MGSSSWEKGANEPGEKRERERERKREARLMERAEMECN